MRHGYYNLSPILPDPHTPACSDAIGTRKHVWILDDLPEAPKLLWKQFIVPWIHRPQATNSNNSRRQRNHHGRVGGKREKMREAYFECDIPTPTPKTQQQTRSQALIIQDPRFLPLFPTWGFQDTENTETTQGRAERSSAGFDEGSGFGRGL